MERTDELIQAKLAQRDKLTEQVVAAWKGSVMSGVRSLSDIFLITMAKFAAETCMEEYEEQIADLRHQRALLAQDMGKFLVDSGLIRDDAALTGPELGMHFETAATHHIALQGLLQELVRNNLTMWRDIDGRWWLRLKKKYVEEENLTTEEIALLDGWAHMLKEGA